MIRDLVIGVDSSTSATKVVVFDKTGRTVAIAANGYDERIYVRGDQDADYGTMMQLMGRINAAGFKRLGLVTLEERDS